MRRMLSFLITTVMCLVALASPVLASEGFLNRVKTSEDLSVSAPGYGPGWVLLSYMPNCPGVGYLSSSGPFSWDYMTITGKAPDNTYGYGKDQDIPKITVWPWGFADGDYGGCAFAYGPSKFVFIGSSSSPCSSAPSLPNDRCGTTEFCIDSALDTLCSPRGVWSKDDGEKDGKKAYSLGCQVYANIGHTGVFSTTPTPAQPLGVVPAGAPLNVRYVTKTRAWVWAKWRGHELLGGRHWAFFPRSCVTTCGDSILDSGEDCDDGNTTAGDGCDENCQEELCFTCSGEPSVCTCDNGSGGCGGICMGALTCSDAGGMCQCVAAPTLPCPPGPNHAYAWRDDFANWWVFHSWEYQDTPTSYPSPEGTSLFPLSGVYVARFRRVNAGGTVNTVGPVLTGIRESDSNPVVGCRFPYEQFPNPDMPNAAWYLLGSTECQYYLGFIPAQYGILYCDPNACGNGIKEPWEECDDGNTAGGDGCDSTCQNEGGG